MGGFGPQVYHFLNTPPVVSDARLDGRHASQRLVDAYEVVVEEREGQAILPSSPGVQLVVGIQIARESVSRVRDRVAGIQVSAPFGKIETAWAVIEE